MTKKTTTKKPAAKKAAKGQTLKIDPTTLTPGKKAAEPDPPPTREFKLLKKPRVAIVGCADTSRQVPFDRADEFEFWGVNNLYITLQGPWTRWFEIHSFKYSEAGRRWERRGDMDFRGMPVDKYLADLQALDVPVYMQQANPIVTNAVLYPVNEMLAMFGDYFTNSISYMIALAIAEGFQEIRILGVDMAVDTEYHWQRPSCEYFIGIARGRGIEVTLPDECDLLKTRFLYAFHEERELAFSRKLKAMRKSMIHRHNNAAAKLEMARKQTEQYTGALSAADEINKIWSASVDLWPEKNRGKLP